MFDKKSQFQGFWKFFKNIDNITSAFYEKRRGNFYPQILANYLFELPFRRFT